MRQNQANERVNQPVTNQKNFFLIENSRREFILKAAIGTAGLTVGGIVTGMSAKSYARIIGANERLNVAIAGLGRRLSAYYDPISRKESNVELVYMCDVMKKQREAAVKKFAKYIDYTPKLENDIRKVIADKNVDVLINATPDHWHAPGTWMAVAGGKHVYVEKPCSQNPREGEILVELQKKSGKIIQMGNQQRSAPESIDIIHQIHNGVIGKAFKAVAFYTSNRGTIPNEKPAPIPDGLDWDLFQGPAPRMAYTADTWDYNRTGGPVALVQLALWNRRSGQQRYPRAGCGPLGVAGRISGVRNGRCREAAFSGR